MNVDGNAVIYCEGAYRSTYGKTAHGLIRFTERYRIIAVIDSTCAGEDSGEVLDHRINGIPIVASLGDAMKISQHRGMSPTHFVIGLATDGGYMTGEVRNAVKEALDDGLHIDSGLHDLLSDDPEISCTAASKGLRLRDIRLPSKDSNHIFSGKIQEVGSVRIALLGTDSAVGKRTTAWLLTHGLQTRGASAEFIGTGQTAWLQGSQYSIILDSLINDYVSGELEHVVWEAWMEKHMDFAIIEGQGSLMNPGYPGGFEILAACRPDGIIMQYAPARKEYDGFPGYPMDTIEDQIFLAEFLSKKKVLAVTINSEHLPEQEIDRVCQRLQGSLGIPVVEPLKQSLEPILSVLMELKR